MDVDALVGQDHGVGAGGVGGAQHGAGVAGVADPGQQGDQARTARPATSGQRHVDQAADGDHALRVDGVRQRRRAPRRSAAVTRTPPASRRPTQVGVPLGRRGVDEDLVHQRRAAAATYRRPCSAERLADRLWALDEEPPGPLTDRTRRDSPRNERTRSERTFVSTEVPARGVTRPAALGRPGQAASPSASRGCATTAGTWARAISTSEVNAAASLTASSASMRRSTSISAAFRPWMNRL